MKRAIASSLFIIMLTSNAFAHRGPYHRPHRHHHHHDHTGAVVGGIILGAMLASCAPEVVEGNVKATENTLNDLASSSEFSEASKFKQTVSEISKMSDDKAKIEAYFNLLEVKSSEEIAHFIGARKDEFLKYAAILADKTDLSMEQAETVVVTLASKLKGNLQ